MNFAKFIPLVFMVLVTVFIGVARADTPVVIVANDKMALPTTVTTDSGTYLVIPNYSTGKPMTVIQVSKTKEKKDD